LKEQYDSVIDMMDKEQLASESNNINIRKLGSDMKPSEFTAGTDYASDKSINGEKTEFPKFAETERFSFMHQIDQEELKKNKGATKFGKETKI